MPESFCESFPSTHTMCLSASHSRRHTTRAALAKDGVVGYDVFCLINGQAWDVDHALVSLEVTIGRIGKLAGRANWGHIHVSARLSENKCFA